jgi:PAS domain-containing protein
MNETTSNIIVHLPLPILLMDENLDLLTASRGTYALFGLRLPFLGREKSKAELTRAIAADESLISQLVAGTMILNNVGNKHTFRWDHAQRQYNVTLVGVKPANTLQYSIYFEDITEHLEYEQNRENARRYIESVLESLPLGIAALDQNMCLTHLNHVQEQFLAAMGIEVSRLEAIGTPITTLFTDDEDWPWDSIQEMIFQEGRNCNDIIRKYTWNTQELILSSRVTPLKNSVGTTIGAIWIAEDVTEKNKLAEELKEAEVIGARFETFRQMTVTLNHQINNSLTTLLLNTEMLKEMEELPPDCRQEMFSTLLSEVNRIQNFTKRLAQMKEIKSTNYLEEFNETMIDLEND